jgi:hypothetical protein
MKSVVVGYHGHCFDGMCSAATVTRLLRAIEPGPLAFSYRGLDHQPGGSHVPEDVLAGDLNAVVDFRYTTSPKLNWWFDHHATGVVGDAEHAHLRADDSGKKFYDPTCGSCCKLIADVAESRFGVSMGEMAETVRWADVIDAARFPDARTAVALTEPALQLMSVIEAHGSDAFLAPRIEALANGASLADLAADAGVQALFQPLLREHLETKAAIQAKAVLRDGVLRFDLVGSGRERYNKFIAYDLFPDARYTVSVTAGDRRTKVSVGSNPWASRPRTHDIAALCARYGGGGHPVVGAVSLAAGEVERARVIATEIAEALAESGEKDP